MRRSRTRFGVAAAGLALTLALGAATPALAATPQHAAGTAGTAGDRDLDLTQYVNPFIGTAVPASSGYAGNVNPGAKVPFGMVNLGPDMPRTDFNGSGGYITAKDATSARVNFFSMTHINGPGCPGQGVVGMMPSSTATPVASATGVPSGVTFKTATESASPGAYSVQLDNQVGVELTATNRTGMARFTYPGADAGFFSIDTRLNGNSNSASGAGKISADNTALTVSDDGRALSGKTVAPAFCTPYGTQFNSNVYFYAEADKPLRAQDPASTVNTVRNNAAVLQYDLTAADPTLTMRIGISSVSVENAKLNLETENADTSFDQVREAADSEWNERLGSVRIDEAANPDALTGARKDELTKFYTALYRVFGSPTTYSDVNGDFRGMDAAEPYPSGVDKTGGVEERPVSNVADYDYTRPDGTRGSYGTHYSGLSMWDSYRSQAQLLALLAPDVSSDVLQSLVVDGEQCGAFPHWVDASDDSTPMAGDNALPFLAGSYAFGARDFDVTSAARLVKQSAFDTTSNCNGRTSMADGDAYLANGYYPDASSSNIEHVAADNAAAEFLDALPADVRSDPTVDVTDTDIATLRDRATWWQNIFDPSTGTIKARTAPTTPGTLGEFSTGSFHESTEPNYFWSFGYAWPDLVDEIGSADAVERLNTLFSVDTALTKVPTITQLNGGQDSQGYYVGNEPAFPAPWAYNAAGRPASTQYVVRQVMQTAFSTARDGLPGNDDLGALSSWYVFAALGMFPTSQAEGQLSLSTPQFSGITLTGGDRTLRITTDGDASTTPFIQSARLDGTDQASSTLSTGSLRTTSTLAYTLGESPSSWASDATASTTSVKVSGRSQTFGTGKPVTATAAVALDDGSDAAGTVVFRAGTETLAEVPVSDGAATATIPATTPVGRSAVTATFVPTDAAIARTSTSRSVPFVVTPTLSRTTVTTSVTTAGGHASVVVTPTVTLGSEVAETGTATVHVNGKKSATLHLATDPSGVGSASSEPIAVPARAGLVVVTWVPDDANAVGSIALATFTGRGTH